MERIIPVLLGLRGVEAQRAYRSTLPIVANQNLVAALSELTPNAETAQALAAVTAGSEQSDLAVALPGIVESARKLNDHLRSRPQLDSQVRALRSIVALIYGMNTFA